MVHKLRLSIASLHVCCSFSVGLSRNEMLSHQWQRHIAAALNSALSSQTGPVGGILYI